MGLGLLASQKKGGRNLSPHERAQIKNLLTHDDIEFVNQGFLLWEMFLPDNFVDFNKELVAMFKLRINMLHRLTFPHIRTVQLWAYGQAATMEGGNIFYDGKYVIENVKHIPDNIVNIAPFITHLQIKNVYRSEEEGHEVLRPFLDNIDAFSGLLDLSLEYSLENEIPPEIFQLTNLKHLAVRRNGLWKVPDEIYFLKNLYSLDLGENRFFEIPESVLSLNWLKELYMDDTALAKIPLNIVRLIDLELLDLSSNQLVSLPYTFADLSNLNELMIDHNQMSGPQNIQDILNILAQMNISNLQIEGNDGWYGIEWPQELTSSEDVRRYLNA